MSVAVDEIGKIVTWYKNLKKDYSNIEDLMYARKKLCTYQYQLAVELGTARQQWKECEVSTEVLKRKTLTDYLKEGMPFTKAVEFSKNECVLMFEAEKIADAYYNTFKFIMDASQEVSATMMQHIALLRKEQESSRGSQV